MNSSFQYEAFVVLAPLAALVSIGVAAYARLRYPSPLTAALVWLNVPTTGWLLCNTLELLAPSQAGTLFWSKATYSMIAFTAVAWLGFALRYTEQTHWLEARRFLLLCLIPVISLLVIWTNEWHHWLWRSYRFTPINGMLAINVDYGPYFWVHSAYSYLLIFVGMFLILRSYIRSFRPYRQQSTFLVIGVLIPILFNLAHVFRLLPGLQKDYTAVSFALGGLAIAFGLFRYRLFDLRPIARHFLVDSLPQAVLVLDMSDRLVDANPAAYQMFGLSKDMIGQPVGRVLAAWQGDLERSQEQIDQSLEIELNHDQDKRYLDLRTALIRDRRGRPTGKMIVLRDITQRKRELAALQKHARELEASNTELDAFAHTVAHDLKNPLAAMISAGDLLRARLSQLSPADTQRMLDMIVSNAQKMNSIIDELLLLSSVRKLSQVTIVPLDMNRLVSQALNRLSILQVQQRAEVIYPDQWPVALGYGPWVEEIWANYLSNAMKYGGPSPRIELGADHIQNGKMPMVRFWVKDNGPGIPKEAQERLFRPFTRLDPARTEGHGLGLSIVLRIVEKLGGQAGVESTLGQGSLFWFTLPAVLPREK